MLILMPPPALFSGYELWQTLHVDWLPYKPTMLGAGPNELVVALLLLNRTTNKLPKKANSKWDNFMKMVF